MWVEGLAGVAKGYVAAAMVEDLGRTALVVTATEDAAERLAGDLPAFGLAPHEVGLYPSSDADLEEFIPENRVLASSVTPERKAMARTRLAVIEALAEGSLKVVVAPVQAVLRETIGPVAENRVTLTQGGSIKLPELGQRLVELGYQRLPMVEGAGHFAVRGGLLDVWPSTHPAPLRLELFGDDIESIREFDPETQRSLTGGPAGVAAPRRREPGAGRQRPYDVHAPGALAGRLAGHPGRAQPSPISMARRAGQGAAAPGPRADVRRGPGRAPCARSLLDRAGRVPAAGGELPPGAPHASGAVAALAPQAPGPEPNERR